ncbi:MAG TPA: 3-dehydroquinate synthase [Thermoanaerobaculia bacterium]|nr:3-dehydroquinate synthase [Thermoanaerobaculia bacterium]
MEPEPEQPHPERLPLRHPGGVSELVLGAGALAAASDELVPWLAGRRVFVVTTPRVWALHGAELQPLLAAASAVERLEVPEGEAAKTLGEAERLWRAMVRAGGKRDSRLLAFGGGSVGDLGGFVAATFLRGISCVQLPTTLLAQVDASIGGKTAVDLPEAKNSVGAFHHPHAVVADTRWLATLDARQRRAGLVEAFKMAYVLDGPQFGAFEALLPGLLAGDPAALATAVPEAAAIKARVVERDPTEQGERALLNFGHTLGHALEAAGGYQGLLHGEAVAWGMLFALRLARRRGLSAASAQRLEQVLRVFALPPLPSVEPETLLTLLGRDKKAREAGVGWVLPVAVGTGRWGVVVPPTEVAAELSEFLRAPLR